MAIRSRVRPGRAPVLALAAVTLVALGPAAGVAAEVRCGDAIAADAVLRRDLVCPRAPALTIRGPAALDLDGHAVRCTGRAPAAAACVVLAGAGARLHGGAVTAYGAAAVRLAGAGGHTVRRVTAVSGADVGFEVRSGGNILVGNTDCRSGAYGFHVAGDGNRLEGNMSSGSAGAGFAVTGAGNELRGNTAVRVEVAGIVVTGTGNRLVGNHVVGVGPGADVRSRFGIVLAAPAGATAVSGNAVIGTDVAVHGGNEIGDAGLYGNRTGIAVVGGTGGEVIAGDRATGGGGLDLVDGGARDGQRGAAVGRAHRERIAPPRGPGCGGAVGTRPEPPPPAFADVRNGGFPGRRRGTGGAARSRPRPDGSLLPGEADMPQTKKPRRKSAATSRPSGAA